MGSNNTQRIKEAMNSVFSGFNSGNNKKGRYGLEYGEINLMKKFTSDSVFMEVLKLFEEAVKPDYNGDAKSVMLNILKLKSVELKRIYETPDDRGGSSYCYKKTDYSELDFYPLQEALANCVLMNIDKMEGRDIIPKKRSLFNTI